MSQASRKSSTFVRPVSTTRAGSLYYCQEIGPQLDLGYQWPQQQPMKAVQGFVKVSAANTHTRQKQIERKMLAKRQKVRKSVWKSAQDEKDQHGSIEHEFASIIHSLR